MSGQYILDGHTPIVENNLMKWAAWFETAERHIAKTEVPRLAILVWLGRLFKTKRFEPVRISTVFLGLDHSFGDGPPLLFETMVFGGTLDQQMERYSTWDEAEKGHGLWVDKVKGTK